MSFQNIKTMMLHNLSATVLKMWGWLKKTWMLMLKVFFLTLSSLNMFEVQDLNEIRFQAFMAGFFFFATFLEIRDLYHAEKAERLAKEFTGE